MFPGPLQVLRASLILIVGIMILANLSSEFGGSHKQQITEGGIESLSLLHRFSFIISDHPLITMSLVLLTSLTTYAYIKHKP